MNELLKDDKLLFMYKNMGCNIARFVSVAPSMEIRYVNINGDDEIKDDLRGIILNLINNSGLKSVNIRSFSVDKMKGNELIYGKRIEDIDEILDIIHTNCIANKYSIINETIDVKDGGVSGVILGNIIEFAPNDTPKCVEKPNICSLEKNMGIHVLNTVYGISPQIRFGDNYRVEFSLHPQREGIRNEHTIIWEYEEIGNNEYDVKIKWPNKFSQFIGDKTFGLIIADYLGLDVPYTTVISRNVAPFSFGKDTGLKERWIRTAPIVKEPGRYFTGDRWTDPFLLMQAEEQKGDNDINIAAILSQSAVEPIFSGGAIITKNRKDDVIEGVVGKGDDFMVGISSNNTIPEYLKDKLNELMDDIRKYYSILGDVSIEWVFDGKKIWVVQLNQLNNIGGGRTIVLGNPTSYDKFFVSEGLEKLRNKIKDIKGMNIGIELVGDVGLCSHFGDILRQANIPSYINK